MEEESKNWVVSEVFEPKRPTINDMALDDRPREKLLEKGADKLSLSELLAILIGSGSTEETAVQLSQRILSSCGNSLNTLFRMSADSLSAYKGMGEAKVARIIAACELSRRREQESVPEQVLLDDAAKVFQYMRPRMGDLTREQGWVLLMNNRFALIKAVKLSEGGITETAIDVRVIAKEALVNDATIVTLCHNHPSGNLHPSRDDDNLTRQVKEALKTLRLYLSDHIIITSSDYYSYNEEGKL